MSFYASEGIMSPYNPFIVIKRQRVKIFKNLLDRNYKQQALVFDVLCSPYMTHYICTIICCNLVSTLEIDLLKSKSSDLFGKHSCARPYIYIYVTVNILGTKVGNLWSHIDYRCSHRKGTIMQDSIMSIQIFYVASLGQVVFICTNLEFGPKIEKLWIDPYKL